MFLQKTSSGSTFENAYDDSNLEVMSKNSNKRLFLLIDTNNGEKQELIDLKPGRGGRNDRPQI